MKYLPEESLNVIEIVRHSKDRQILVQKCHFVNHLLLS
jgi:hypothetical protein